jgi:precorrin-3B methylase
VVVTDLEHMLNYEIGMNTTIIGNSATFTPARWIVTPRGYQTKYDLAGEPTQEHGV